MPFDRWYRLAPLRRSWPAFFCRIFVQRIHDAVASLDNVFPLLWLRVCARGQWSSFVEAVQRHSCAVQNSGQVSLAT